MPDPYLKLLAEVLAAGGKLVKTYPATGQRVDVLYGVSRPKGKS